jgi:hypothetical protein
MVNPNGSPVTACHVDYGTTEGYGAQVPCSPDPGSGTAAVLVTAALGQLASATTYHFRIVATGIGGTSVGDDRTFATAPTPPSCATDASLCPPPACDNTPALCPSPQLPVATLARKATVKSGKVTLTVSCKGAIDATCKGPLALTAKVKVKVKKGKRTKTTTKTISVGKASYRVAVGERQTIAVKLSRAARRALDKGALTVTAKRLKGSVKLPKLG